MKRGISEKIFILFFIPAVVTFYALYKYPDFFFGVGVDTRLAGKSLSFWYVFFYTAIVCGIAARVVLKNRNVYSNRSDLSGTLSPYQKKKFVSIFFVQLIGFFLIPYVLMPLMTGSSFWDDPIGPPGKNAHVYFFPAFTSVPMAIYLLIAIPIFVHFFGKRYCSWICSCGNLAETIGVTVWGKKWVREGTPRGDLASTSQWIPRAILLFSVVFGLLLLSDTLKIFSAEGWILRLRAVQDFGVDFMFGSVIGIGAYPFLGTRIWCRYGCPLAKFMELSGTITKSRFQVQANDRCTGIGLCSKACPMGIDVAAYAHKDKKPIFGSFGLKDTVCVGCGGCIDVCPTKALSFR